MTQDGLQWVELIYNRWLSVLRQRRAISATSYALSYSFFRSSFSLFSCWWVRYLCMLSVVYARPLWMHLYFNYKISTTYYECIIKLFSGIIFATHTCFGFTRKHVLHRGWGYSTFFKGCYRSPWTLGAKSIYQGVSCSRCICWRALVQNLIRYGVTMRCAPSNLIREQSRSR